MSDSKYGRIFTEDDVRAMLGPDSDNVIDEFEGRFPKDEPIFIFRAKDKKALSVIRNYEAVCRASRNVVRSHVDGIEKAVRLFENFRRDNPHKMKQPD